MPNEFAIGGASPARQSRFAPLYNSYFSTGLVTQRNPLRPGSGTALTTRYYGSKNDSLLDGLNIEVSNRLTLVRRPGSSIYNSQVFPPINSFYSFRLFDANDENIKVMADTSSVIYDATGPNTKDAIFTKSAGAGQAYFQSVGNTLYFGDGVDQEKWVQSAKPWQANTKFDAGQFVIDSNGNIQVAWGGITCAIDQVQISGNVLSLSFDVSDEGFPDNLLFLVGLQLTLSGFVNATFLNGQTVTINSVEQGNPASTSNVVKASFVHADYGPADDTGTATSGSGTTGNSQPAWASSAGVWTYGDGGEQWLGKGKSVEKWGIATPTKAPTVSQSTLPQSYPAWSSDTYYSTSYLIQDPFGNIQKATTFGSTGATEPSWNTTTGGTTSDGTVVWTNQGAGNYQLSTGYSAGSYVVAGDTLGNKFFYKALNSGVSGGVTPTFPAPLGSQVTDNNIVWVNIGVWAVWSDITASTISGSFGLIPLHGGGSIVLGVGQDQPYGSIIALPTGYSASNLIAWSSPGVGFSGSSVVTEGVYQSTTSGGTLRSSFQGNFGGSAFNATSNWAAAAWTSGAEVTVTTVGGIQYVSFTTAEGDDLCICSGQVSNGSSVSIPSGFSASQFQYIVGMAGADNPGHIMQGVTNCTLDGTLTFSGGYTDEDSNVWHGPGSVFGIFWKTGGGVSTQGVTGGTALLIPIIEGNNLAIIQSVLNHGQTFGIPSGYSSASVQSTAAPSGYTPSSDHHGHGWSCLLTGQTFEGYYADGSGNQWNMSGNVLAIAVPQNTTDVSEDQEVIDTNGRIEKIVSSGLSGFVTPAWKTSTGSITNDNSAKWRNTGIGTAAWTDSARWAYSFKNSVTGAVSTASPISAPLTLDENSYAFLQGQGSDDSQVDTIVIFRTVQGGSVLLYEDEIPAPPAGQQWQYYDENPDTELNVEIVAPINHQNDPPPVGLGVLTYYLGRIWGAVNNSVYFSGGPDTTIGNGDEAFPPANVFVFPDKVTRLFPSSVGLLVFTVSDVYVIQGTTTAAFFSVPFFIGLGLPNYNAFSVNGSTPYFFTSDFQIVALDLSGGAVEVGFNIGDQFLNSNWNSSNVHVTYHISGSPDKGLYVSDFSNGWFRLYPTPAPETGQTWAPFAGIVNGCSAVESIQTASGVRNLLIGPKTFGPILKRDDSVFTDNGQPYDAFGLIGSIVLAEPGQLAEILFMTFDSVARGNRPSVSIQLDEIAPYSAGMFESLPAYVQDPTELVPSVSMYSNRYYLSQTQQPALGRNMQVRLDWGNDTVQNELLSMTIFGGYSTEL